MLHSLLAWLLQKQPGLAPVYINIAFFFFSSHSYFRRHTETHRLKKKKKKKTQNLALFLSSLFLSLHYSKLRISISLRVPYFNGIALYNWSPSQTQLLLQRLLFLFIWVVVFGHMLLLHVFNLT